MRTTRLCRVVAVGPMWGPTLLLAHMPEMAQRLEALRTYLRDEESVPQQLQELVMLTVAREMDCAFIWYAHAAAARQAGVRDDIVDCLRDKQALPALDPAEQTVVQFTRELLQHRKVSQATFEAASRQFGQRGTMTLTNLVACYAVLAYNMNTYELESARPCDGTSVAGRGLVTLPRAIHARYPRSRRR